MQKNSGSRNQRNNPYVIDTFAVRFHHTAAGVAWRWRTELAHADPDHLRRVRLTLRMTLTGRGRPGRLISILAAVPVTRRFPARRFWCVLVRHRIHRLCWEARLHTGPAGSR